MTQTPQTVNISAVVDSPTQPRQRYRDLAELEASIKAMGILQPILVRPNGSGTGGKFECVFGHRRLRAAKAAGLEVIPANVRELSDLEVVEAQLVENCQRDDIDPMDEADAYARVIDAGVMTAEDVAIKVGKSTSHIYRRLKLATLGIKARGALWDETITPAVALLLTRLDGRMQEKALKEVAVEKGQPTMLLNQATSRLRSFTHDLRNAPFPTSSAGLVNGAGTCACVDCPKRSGNQTDLFGELAGDEPEACTDPKCYEAKVAGWWKRSKEKAEANGAQVLTSKEAFDGTSAYPRLKRTMVPAQDSPEEWRPGRRKSWKSYLGKSLRPSIAQHPATGEIVEVYNTAEAKKALGPEDRKRLFPPKPKGTQKPRKTAGDPVLDWHVVDDETNRRWCAAMVEKFGQMSEDHFVGLIANTLLAADFGPCDVMAAIDPEWAATAGVEAGLRRTTGKEKDAITKRATQLTGAEAMAVVFFEVTRESQIDREDIFTDMGLNHDKIHTVVEDELRAKLKAETKAKADAEKKAAKEKAAGAKKAKASKKKAAKKGAIERSR